MCINFSYLLSYIFRTIGIAKLINFFKLFLPCHTKNVNPRQVFLNTIEEE